MSKNKPPTTQPTTRTSVASRVASMAAASSETTSSTEGVSMSQLVAKLDKQRSSLKEDISALIQESIASLQSSVNTLTETVTSFQARLNATESLAGDNFAVLHMAERKIKQLEEQTATLLDWVEDMEKRSRRANLRILNVPEDSEKGQTTVKFVSEMLMEVMGEGVFEKPSDLERALTLSAKSLRRVGPPVPW